MSGDGLRYLKRRLRMVLCYFTFLPPLDARGAVASNKSILKLVIINKLNYVIHANY